VPRHHTSAPAPAAKATSRVSQSEHQGEQSDFVQTIHCPIAFLAGDLNGWIMGRTVAIWLYYSCVNVTVEDNEGS
jgi:hypothetical protein